MSKEIGGMLSDIKTVNDKGWAVEFRPAPKQGFIEVLFRRYEDVDIKLISGVGKDHLEAYLAAEESWEEFVKAEKREKK